MGSICKEMLTVCYMFSWFVYHRMIAMVGKLVILVGNGICASHKRLPGYSGVGGNDVLWELIVLICFQARIGKKTDGAAGGHHRKGS